LPCNIHPKCLTANNTGYIIDQHLSSMHFQIILSSGS
jgi:hypothetical protein